MAEPLPSTPVVEARGLRKSYAQAGCAFDVLRGLDLAVRRGELLAVLGPSGSGKSTLLNLLGLMDEPSAGEVMLFGRPTVGTSPLERARLRSRSVGFIFQFDSLLPEFTVLENVMMPGRIKGETEGLSRNDFFARLESDARELLALLDILPLAGRFPQTLSGGERQRAAIARALINRPGVILADEPTGNLDRKNGESVFGKMRGLADTLGVAVVLATHNEYISHFATRIVHLADGRIAETGA